MQQELYAAAAAAAVAFVALVVKIVTAKRRTGPSAEMRVEAMIEVHEDLARLESEERAIAARQAVLDREVQHLRGRFDELEEAAADIQKRLEALE